MSRKQWLFLFLLYIIYLLFGALVFQLLEAQQDYDEKYEAVENTNKLELMSVETLARIESAEDQQMVLALLATIEEIRGPVLPLNFSLSDISVKRIRLNTSLSVEEISEGYRHEDIDVTHYWDLWNTFYFAFITITTIGYGHLYPKTMWGQQFCIVYSLFGIPFNTIVFVSLSQFYKQYFLTKEDQIGGTHKSNFDIVIRATLYLLPGMFVLLILPAVVFHQVENWTFLESYYYAFISLTTIGYGEFVAGHPSHYGVFDGVYKVFIMLWTMFGLSYIIMVVGFIMSALTSKQMRDVQKTTRKKIQRVTSLMQDVVSKYSVRKNTRTRRYPGSEKITRKERKGLDNLAFTQPEHAANNNAIPSIAETSNVNEQKGPTKVYIRRVSFTEKFRASNQNLRRNNSSRRTSLNPNHLRLCLNEPVQATIMVPEEVVNENGPGNQITELLSAVHDLIESEFVESEISDSATAQLQHVQSKISLTSLGNSGQLARTAPNVLSIDINSDKNTDSLEFQPQPPINNISDNEGIYIAHM